MSISPEQEKILKLYKSKTPILQNFDVTKKIKSAFGKTVNMKNIALGLVENSALKDTCYIETNEGKNNILFSTLPFLRNK